MRRLTLYVATIIHHSDYSTSAPYTESFVSAIGQDDNDVNIAKHFGIRPEQLDNYLRKKGMLLQRSIQETELPFTRG